MIIEKYLNQLDIEEIYKTILDLEGPKHPLNNWDELEYAAKYINDKMKSYGLKTEFQDFYIKGFEKPFKNVFGYIGDSSQPAIVLGSHYDTVIDAPGANDNLSAVAVSLEIARVLSEFENPPSVIIAVFTLEEGYPTLYKRFYETARKKGWMDNKNRFTSLEMLDFDRQLKKLVINKRRETKQTNLKIYETILKEHNNDYSENELDYIQTVYEAIKELESLYIERKFYNYALVGSTMFVDKILRENININYVINLDTIGWITNEEGTQKTLPITEDMLPLISCYKMDIKSTIGNFIAIMANRNAKHLLDEYINQCSKPEIDMPCLGLYLPFDIDMIYVSASDTLRSDHAPFWAVDIPGIFISDSGNFRSPYYHTAEDKYYHINFEALLKIAKVTLSMMLLS